MQVHNVNGGEFRTPPLWGIGRNITLLRDNGFSTLFMHDGSASSLTEAIKAHNGDARSAKRAFNNLSGSEQSQVVRFLESL